MFNSGEIQNNYLTPDKVTNVFTYVSASMIHGRLELRIGGGDT